jgi:hypothetical protein
MYVGTAAGFGVLHPVFASGFMQGVGSRSLYSSATQDCANKFAVAQHMYGFPFTQPFPDIDRTRVSDHRGGQPGGLEVELPAGANAHRALKAIEARGARLFVVDPRRTETAKRGGRARVSSAPTRTCSSTWRFCTSWCAGRGRPGPRGGAHAGASTRCWRWPRRGRRSGRAVTQIPAEKLREMVAVYRTAEGAALYCSTGVNMGTQRVARVLAARGDQRGERQPRPRGGTLVGRGSSTSRASASGSGC